MGKISKNSKVIASIVLILVLVAGSAFYIKHIKDDACSTDCNVILISVDSLRADHLSSYGYSRQTSPNFDKLASKSFIFKNYYSSNYLTPTTEAVVHTGKYSTSNGVTNFNKEVPEDIRMLAEYMKSANYKTQSIVTSPEFNSYPSIRTSFSRGFDKITAPNKQSSSTAEARKNPQNKLINETIESFKDTDKNQFLWIALGGIHWPFGANAPDVYADPNYEGKLANINLDFELFMNTYKNVVYPSKTQLQSEDVNHIINNYDDGIREFDNFLGNILKQLEENKLDKKTIIVIQSEHGEALNEQGYYAHYDIYDNQIKTPLLIYDPRLPGGKQLDVMASSVDVLPTILDLTNNTSSSNFDGKSLGSVIKSTEKDGSRPEVYIERVPLWEEAILTPNPAQRGLYAEDTGAKDIAIRTDKWKYILRLANQREEQISIWSKISGQKIKIPKAELYDIVNDPKEQINVIAKYPDIAQALNKKLIEWHESVKANAPTKVKQTELVQPYQ